MNTTRKTLPTQDDFGNADLFITALRGLDSQLWIREAHLGKP